MSEKPAPKFSPRLTVFAAGSALGMGIGFIFYFPHNIFAWIGCMFAGIGVGLFLAAYLPPKKDD